MNLLGNAIQNIPFPQKLIEPVISFDRFLAQRNFRLAPKGIKQLELDGIIRPVRTNPRCFHPFQIWPISDFLNNLSLNLTSVYSHIGHDESRLRQVGPLNWKRQIDDLSDYSSTDFFIDFQSRLLPLLLWIESYYLPVIRGDRPGRVTLTNCEYTEWKEWQRSTEPITWLAAHSISVDQLLKWHGRLLWKAHSTDPCPNLYLLLRSTSYGQREQFTGPLRLAYDLYEIAELLRRFLEEVTDTSIRKEWDPRGSPDSTWVERIYGSQPRFGDPEFLRPLIRNYGLDPAFRVMWMIEGDTEQGFIDQYYKRLGIDISRFVTIQNFVGDSQLKNKVPAIDASLETARRDQRFVTLTFDDSKELRRRVRSLVREGLINIPFVVNDPDFELGNFQIAQLVDVALIWARDIRKPIGICREELVSHVEYRTSNKNRSFDRALNDILQCEGEEFRLSKGTNWGQRLADYLSDRRDAEAETDEYSEEELTSIELQILRVSRSSEPVIDYPSSVDEIDPSNLEIRGNRLTEKEV